MIPDLNNAYMKDSRTIDVMGIINITDNSYYAASRCLDSTGAPNIDIILKRACGMVEEGATILDIGACSTRQGSEAVGVEGNPEGAARYQNFDRHLLAVYRAQGV